MPKAYDKMVEDLLTFIDELELEDYTKLVVSETE